MYRFAMLMLVPTLLLIHPPVARCDIEGEAASLSGLHNVRATLKLDTDEQSDSAFLLSKLSVQKDLEKLLSGGGLTIVQENPEAVVHMLLKIRVLSPREATVKVFMYRLELGVEQEAALQRAPTKVVRATTWRNAEAGMGLQNELKEGWQRLIERQADLLVEAWKKAQP